MVNISLMVRVNVYYFTIQYNSYQYGNQLLACTVPIALSPGYSLPSSYTSGTVFGGNGFPTVLQTPFITILDNNYLTWRFAIPLRHFLWSASSVLLKNLR